MLKLCQNAKSSIQNGLCFERKQVPRIGVRPCKTCVLVYGMKWSALPYKQERTEPVCSSRFSRKAHSKKLPQSRPFKTRIYGSWPGLFQSSKTIRFWKVLRLPPSKNGRLRKRRASNEPLDTIANNSDARVMRYDGGKGACYRQLINLMPPHRRYVETHLGGGAVIVSPVNSRCPVNIS